MKNQQIRTGFSNYYVLEKDQESTYEDEILWHNQIPGLVSCELRCEGKDEFYYYEVGRFHLWSEELEKCDPRAFFLKMFEIMETMEDYLLNLDHIQLNLKSIFVSDGQPFLIFAPGYSRDITKQLQSLLEECIDEISYEKRENTVFFYEFYNFVNNETPNLEKINEFLMPDIKEEPQEIQESVIFEPEPEKKGGRGKLAVAAVCLTASVLFFVYCIVELCFRGILFVWVRNLMASVLFASVNISYLVRYGRKAVSKKEEPVTAEKENTQLLTEETVLLEPKVQAVLVPVIDGEAKREQAVSICSETFLVGSRPEQVDYFLDSVGVSREHMMITKEKQSFFLKDCHSTNGTFVNGRQLGKRKRKLNHGDHIRIGRNEFLFFDTDMI